MERVSREMSFEKGLASRTASSLIKQGLLDRRTCATDGRAVTLSLTSKGRELLVELGPWVEQWNEEWLSVLTKKERETFLQCLDKLIAETHRVNTRLARSASGAPRR